MTNEPDIAAFAIALEADGWLRVRGRPELWRHAARRTGVRVTVGGQMAEVHHPHLIRPSHDPRTGFPDPGAHAYFAGASALDEALAYALALPSDLRSEHARDGDLRGEPVTPPSPGTGEGEAP